MISLLETKIVAGCVDCEKNCVLIISMSQA